MDRIHAVVIVLLAIFISTSPAAALETNDLTLEQAITLAIEKSPELTSASWEVRARQGRVMQVDTLPNPEIEFSIDNFLGNKDLRGFDGAEYTLAITQLIELGGKRAKRAYVAGIERNLAGWDYEAKKHDLLNEVTKAFIDVIAQQELLEVNNDIYRIAEQSLATVSARVQAGKVSPIEETRASTELSKTRIELARAKISLDAARKRLSTLLGSPTPFFEKAIGQLNLDANIPSWEQLVLSIGNNPDIARWLSEVEQRKAALNLEQANRISDPSVSIGVKRFTETETSAIVAGISFPLPLFNRNTGAIAESESRLSKANEEQKAAILKTQTAVTAGYLALSSAFAEATALKTDIIPGIQGAFDAVQEGYRYGKFAYLDLLDAQRSLAESKKQYIESLAAYGKAYADIERLTASGMGKYSSNAIKNQGD
ncbi:MAG: TolC family protein [Candidatus Magnetobacterium sp. LHC-1]|nr:TolC family protein [Nitrospirota bacterium]